MSNINKKFNKISKKRDLSGQKRIEKKPEKEAPQPAIRMVLRMKYSNRSVQKTIFQKC